MKNKVCYYDIETSYIISKNWGIWQQNAIGVIEDFQILSVAWQWEGEKKVHVMGQDDFKGYKPGKNDDTKLVKFIRDEIFQPADIVIAHNGDRFDQPKCRARMIIRNLEPIDPPIEIDTKKMAKRVGGFTSNSLKDLARQLNVAMKGDSGGIETWDGVLAGDPKAWKKLKQYNKQDIPPLRDIYMRLRAWDKRSPLMNILEDVPNGCHICAGTNLVGQGTRPTRTGKKQRYQCKDCGGWNTGRNLINSYNHYTA